MQFKVAYRKSCPKGRLFWSAQAPLVFSLRPEADHYFSADIPVCQIGGQLPCSKEGMPCATLGCTPWLPSNVPSGPTICHDILWLPMKPGKNLASNLAVAMSKHRIKSKSEYKEVRYAS